MFRAALFSIVLTLAVGQDATALCKVWCDPHDATTAGCHQAAPTESATLTGTDSCDTVVVEAVALVREDARRGASAPDLHHAVFVTRSRFASPPTDARSSYEPGQQSSPDERPLVTALRI